MRYAAKTTVSAEKSRVEIEQILIRYGATGFLYGWNSEGATVMFRYNNKNIRFVLPLPDRKDRQFTHTEARGSLRQPDDQAKHYDQAIRQRWRALTISIKAKLETVESGIASFEEEFLSYIIVQDGQTVAQWLIPQLEDFYLSGKGPKALMAPK